MVIFTKSFTVWNCCVLSSLAGYHVNIDSLIYFRTGRIHRLFHSLRDLLLFHTLFLFQERQNDTTLSIFLPAFQSEQDVTFLVGGRKKRSHQK